MSIDQTVSDFDGVIFHISTPDTKTKIVISIQIRCYKDLVRYGAEDVLNREYGPYVIAPEPGYDFSIQVDLENLPESKEEREELVKKISLLKRNAMAGPFEQAYQEHYQLKAEAAKFTTEEAPQGVREGGEVKAIHYREEEAIYVKASHDRVTVIFSTVFREETDRVFGKVFIQEFVDARRRAIQNAPQVLFRNDPPLELQDVPGVKNTGTGDIGYVTFGMFWLGENVAKVHIINAWAVLFPRHLTPQRMPDVISHIQTFRDYFHYHIKASKAYIHTRMRRRTADFLQGKQFLSTCCIAHPANNRLQFSAERDRRTRRRNARRRAAGLSRLAARGCICDLLFHVQGARYSSQGIAIGPLIEPFLGAFIFCLTYKTGAANVFLDPLPPSLPSPGAARVVCLLVTERREPGGESFTAGNFWFPGLPFPKRVSLSSFSILPGDFTQPLIWFPTTICSAPSTFLLHSRIYCMPVIGYQSYGFRYGRI